MDGTLICLQVSHYAPVIPHLWEHTAVLNYP